MDDIRHEETRDKEDAPHPDHPDKPSSPTDLTRGAWKYIGRRSVAEFVTDECTDLAAALTYFAVLSVFPGLLAVVSLLGVFGQGEATTEAIVGWLEDNAPESLVTLLAEPIDQLATTPSAGFALAVGLLGALWTASGYVGAFGRAMNRIYEVGEGRPVWKLRPWNVLVTVVLVLLVVVIMLIVLLSGGVAEAVGSAVGLGETALLVWNVVKWPILFVLAVTLVAVLYYATPNVRQPRFRWLTVGSFLAVVVMALAGVGFGFYVSNFASYNATYGIIGSVIVLLLGVWLMNLALMLGAEIDAELERGRELQAGLAAEETIQLPPRDSSGLDKKKERQDELVRRAGSLRRTGAGTADEG